MSYAQPFTYGPFTVVVMPVKEIIKRVSELPNMVADMETFGFKCMRLSTTSPATQTEVIQAIRDPHLERGLRNYLTAEKGKEVINLTPKPLGLQFHVTYPDFRLGALNTADMKIYAKMSLNPLLELRMFRSKRKTRLENSVGIFGKWTVGDESGIFSIDYFGYQTLVQVCDRPPFEADLSEEFAKRWPLYPKAVFEILPYSQVRELMTDN